MTDPWDVEKAKKELEWLQKHPWFEEKPASMPEFLGEGYLNIAKGIRPGVRQVLVDIFGEEVNGDRIALYKWGMFTGAIGIGKTTLASVILPYMVHWVLCLKDPQGFFDLLPGSRIAFMQMSTSGPQAKETVFGDIKARIEHSKWFTTNYPYDPSFKNQIRFKQKDIWILPGDSAETTFEGYNILGGILDEADSHKKTEDKDYAEVGWETINNRIGSRFQDRGFLLTVGQMKSATGFASRKYAEHKADKENAYTVRMTIWESLGWEKFLKSDGTRDSFWYDMKRKEIIPTGAAALIEGGSENIMEIPTVYRKSFENQPEKALRDLAGIPPNAEDPFISLTYKIDEAIERWNVRYDNLGSPVDTDTVRPQFADWFVAKESLKRAVHVDFAYSSAGDALGFAMGHVAEIADVDGEMKPYIVFDCLLRMKAAPGTEIMLSEVRTIIYDLKDERGFNIKKVTADGFESTEFKQQLRKRRYNTSYVSVDRSKLPYTDLRDALYENRIEFPPYYTYLKKGADQQIQIAVRELEGLSENDKKIDHQPDGSKDVTDAMAGVVYTLMGDRSYRRNVTNLDERRQRNEDLQTGTDSWRPPQPQAPVPPAVPGYMGTVLPIPPRLRPRR